MGGKNKNILGRALVKDKYGSSKGKRKVDNGSMLHTTEVQDGYEWGRLNLQSVTEESSFQEFLSTAELAGTEFQAEKLNLKLVSVNNISEAVTSLEARASIEKRHEASKHLLRVPRRPPWTKELTAEVLKENEKQAFLNWRRDLALLQEKEGLLLTPYEKNIEFWRQLWRVLERSHILVQVLDARNPLLFRCEDLEAYAEEVGVSASLLILNKADLLSEPQRKEWAKYFDNLGIKIAFFSATLAAEQNKLEKIKETEETSDAVEETSDAAEEENFQLNSNKPEPDIENSQSESSEGDVCSDDDEAKSSVLHGIVEDVKKLDLDIENTARKLKSMEEKLTSLLSSPLTPKPTEINEDTSGHDDKNDFNILSRNELIELLQSFPVNKTGRLSIGMVGYPNVGKSSTINALMEAKKVSVSATPGKTKHFQTLILSDELMLVDCPGLVLPSFVCTKADMILHGILPLDQMKEYMDAVQILVEGLGSRSSVERRLCIMLPPASSDKPDAVPPRDLLLAYAYSRGMMTGAGAPDCARAARALLRAACIGKLPLAIPPPGVDPVEFRKISYPLLPEMPESSESTTKKREMTPKEKLALKTATTSDDIDQVFFNGPNLAAHVKGKCLVKNSSKSGDEAQIAGKPWKQINKHANKKKREKLRRIYGHLDEH